MNGQWFGELTGTSSGAINLDVDEQRARFEGVAYVATTDEQWPDLFLLINTPDKSGRFSVQLKGLGFVHEGAILSKVEAQKYYPDVLLPDFFDTEWEVGAREISVDWHTNIGTQGHVSLKLNDGDRPSTRIAEQRTTWSSFKEYVSSISGENMIFRGQEDHNWRLRTAFHREGRANVYRFGNDDIPILYKSLRACFEMY